MTKITATVTKIKIGTTAKKERKKNSANAITIAVAKKNVTAKNTLQIGKTEVVKTISLAQ